MAEIPEIDLSLDEDAVADKLYSALTNTGFATLINHGLDKSVRENAFAASKAFFHLPTEAKLECGYRGHKSNRGYIGCGKETHDEAVSADFKETYDINPDNPSLDPALAQPWPAPASNGPLKTFQENLTEYFDAMDRLHLRILRLIEIGLKIPPNFLVERCNERHENLLAERHENLRLLHYPEIQVPNDHGGSGKDRKPIVRGSIHTDFGTLTLLTQDSSGGLMVQGLDGKWVPVTPVPDSVVVNVGDMLQRLTNGVLKANPHQIVETNPASSIPGGVIPERFSIAFFCNANRETMLECLEQCVSEERPAKYKPVKAFDYITQRLSDTISD